MLIHAQGGGCGIGLGFGWGFFAVAVGTPFKRMETLLGVPDRLLDRAQTQLREDRAAGRRPPFGRGLPGEPHTKDALIDRILRSILARRARTREGRGSGGAAAQ